MTINYGLEINDKAPISGPHKNSDWTDNIHNRKHGIGGPVSILGSQSRDCTNKITPFLSPSTWSIVSPKGQSLRPITQVILRQRVRSGFTSLEPTWQPGTIIERRQGWLMRWATIKHENHWEKSTKLGGT